MTPGERDAFYVLQRHFGISYHEAEYVRPAWEIENLLMGWGKEARGAK